MQLKDQSLWVDKALIDGELVEAISGKRFDVEDPSTREVIGSAPEMDTKDVERSVTAAQTAFQTFRKISGRERARMLRAYNDIILANAEDFAKIIVAENGKPLKEAQAEVTYAASFLEFFSGEAERTNGLTIPAANPTSRIITIKQPIGVVASLCPWNLPIAMAARKIAAVIASGCTTVVKPAGETPFATLTFCHLAQRAGIPKGVINCITGLKTTAEIGKALCEEPRVKKISFTGSTAVGKLLVKQSADTLKKMSLELGGNAPFIVFEDANLDDVISQLFATKLRNCGQTCTAANRILVQKTIVPEFVKRLQAEIEKIPVGGGRDPNVGLGPLMSVRGVEKVKTHVEDALNKGAKLSWQANKSNYVKDEFKNGFFYPPTIITGLTSEMQIWKEESFGPLSAIGIFENEQEALQKANDSQVGLGAYLFTKDIDRAWRMAEEIETGMVAINHGMLSAAEGAFGGVKESGYGREGSVLGLDDYMNIKTLNFRVTPAK